MKSTPTYIPRYAMVPKRDGLGRIIPEKLRLFWGGRKPGKYQPHVGAKQLLKLRRASAQPA